MYASVKYNLSVTSTEALGDTVGLLTGTITNVSQLSANASKVHSYVKTQVAGGWELYDDISATKKILRAPISDMEDEYKYMMLTSVSTSLKYQMYGDWDADSHTGTEWLHLIERGTTNEGTFYYTSTTRDTLAMISSSVNHFAACYIGYENMKQTDVIHIYSERTRNSSWDTPENGIKPLVCSTGIRSNNFYNDTEGTSIYNSYDKPFMMPQTMHLNGSVVTTRDCTDNDNGQYLSCPIVFPTYNNRLGDFHENYSKNLPDKLYDENLEEKVGLIPFGCARVDQQNFGGEISQKCGIYFSTLYSSHPDFPTPPYTNDVYTIDDQDYRIWFTAGATGKGYNYFLVTDA